MNWTEGNLSRHSKGRQRNELLARQKQHFAKVRSGLLNSGPKQSSISISFLDSPRSRTSGRRDHSIDASPRSPSIPPLLEKRRRTKESQDSPQSQSSIREKKRRLLDKTDWVGLDLQQPIDITFPGRLQPAPGSKWSRVDRPRVHTVQRIRDTRSSPRFEPPPPAKPRPLKIQIGSQVIQPSQYTASQPSTRRYSLVPRRLASSSLRSNTISSPPPSHARQLYAPAENGSETSHIYEARRDGTHREYSSAYRERPPVKPLTPEEPACVAYASSIMYEPAPRRPNSFSVLGWSPSSSEDRGSMQVEIERPSRPAPLSQNADQKSWWRLAVGSSESLPEESSMDSQVGISLSDSSTSILSPQFQGGVPNQDVSSDLGFSTSYLDLGPAPGRQAEESVQSAPRKVDDQILEHGGRLDHPQKEVQKEVQRGVQKQVQKKVQPVDDNAAWMRLVFDGDSDELEEKAFEEAAHQAAMEMHPSDSSTGLAGAVESVAGQETDTSFDKEREPSESRMATHGTVVSESAASDEATAGSTQVAESEAPFRFAIPRTFVGKLVDPNAIPQKPPILPRRRGRPKKKAADGRTDIRRLPDFDGDPIEEFDED
ncbi:hypothetical protein F4821DRAFT_263995 [Hypoxylon rubiginosum]|uniref:Uncharacterized protein n=1 Tax=Hypoxylon rubiginosum TaxID=110542 RepID=A0ACC0CPV6_9PEZI|nr:hypothetical protein F4821DRAFT_263995 [Hypoxylon rubiginosum]